MPYFVAALIVILGVAMVISGVTSSGGSLFEAVTGKGPGPGGKAATASTADVFTQAALTGLTQGSGATGGTGALPTTPTAPPATSTTPYIFPGESPQTQAQGGAV